MRKFANKLLNIILSSMFVLSAAITAQIAVPSTASASQVVVSRVTQTAEGKKYLEVDGQPFMVGHVQNGGTLEITIPGAPLPLSALENVFEKTKAAGFQTISIILRWRDWEPTTQGVYDWTYIDQYVEWAKQYDMRIDFAYFGTNSVGGTRLTGYEQGWVTNMPDYLQDKAKYFGNGDPFQGVNHVPWLPDGGIHDADARFLMNSEVSAITALFNHLAVKDTTHRTIFFQILNEFNIHNRYWTSPIQRQLIWNWMNAIGNAIKSSDYVVATRVNSGGAIPMYDYQSISQFSGIDAIGDDAYSTSVPYISNLIRNQNALGGTNLPHIAENDGRYDNHTSLEIASLVNGGYYDVWCLNANGGQGMYSDSLAQWTLGTNGAMFSGTTRMSYLLPALYKIGSLVSTTAPYRMAGFNIDTDSPAASYSVTKQVYNYEVNYTGNDVAMALSNGNYVYVVSDTSSSAAFKVYQQPVAVTSGHLDGTGTWVVDAVKTYTNNGDGSYSVSYSPKEAVRIELPAASGTMPAPTTPTPYSDGINIAQYATATASSTFSGDYPASNAIDGSTITHYGATAGDWASNHDTNPSLELDWSSPQTINKVVLFDRANPTDNANGGTLTFSDGSSINVSDIDIYGAAKTITFPDKTVTWVRFQTVGGSGLNVGLSEMQAFLSSSAPRPSTLVNIAPESIVTASSYFNASFLPSKAVDGIVGSTSEWASSSDLNPSIQFNWTTLRTVNKITFYDRPNMTDWAPGGTLTFSDGSTVNVSGIPNDGSAFSISFADKNISWVKFEVSGGSGLNVGFSEIQVYSSGASPSNASGNVALTATATASSSFSSSFLPSNALDGSTGSEWASSHDLNPSIQLNWATSQSVNQIVIYDRPNTTDNANGGTLTFSDGSSLSVSGIPIDGTPLSVTFPSKSITWVSFQVSGGSGLNVGLSEFQVFLTGGTTAYLPSMPDVGWWKFDETRGNIAYGSTSLFKNGIQDWHNATMVGATTAAGTIENALNLNGSSGYAMINNLSHYSLPNDTVTYSAWVYANAATPGSSIIQNWGSTTTGQISLALNANSKLSVQVAQSNGTVVSSNEVVAFPAGSWQLVTVVADGTYIKLYRNGQLVATVAYNGTLKTGFSALGVGVKPNDAGTGPDSTTPGYWNGMIDDLRIYSNALNDAEIAGLAGITGSPAPALVSLNKTITGYSSQYDTTSWKATNVNDGTVSSTSRGWASVAGSGTRNEWVTMDLGQSYQLFSFTIQNEDIADNRNVKDFVLYGSTTGAFAGEEFVISSGTIPSLSHMNSYSVNFTPANARYIKFKGTSSYSSFVIVGELSLYGQ